MGVTEFISRFEAVTTLEQLQMAMQEAVESFGFSSYNFFDAGRPHTDEPLYFGTTGIAWENEYKSNGFIRYDHTLSHARKTNIGFKWTEVPLPIKQGIKRPASMQLMDAAQDHGFRDGYILPYHFVDLQGRTYSTLSALFWKDDVDELARALTPERRTELNLMLLYWTQRVVTLLAESSRAKSAFGELPEAFTTLTDRERETLEWAARGRTMAETSELLQISQETVKTHLQRAIEKLGAINKIHAVAKAYRLGLIDF